MARLLVDGFWELNQTNNFVFGKIIIASYLNLFLGSMDKGVWTAVSISLLLYILVYGAKTTFTIDTREYFEDRGFGWNFFKKVREWFWRLFWLEKVIETHPTEGEAS